MLILSDHKSHSSYLALDNAEMWQKMKAAVIYCSQLDLGRSHSTEATRQTITFPSSDRRARAAL